MEKELQGKLTEILSQLQAAVGKASDFTVAQLPDIVQSYILYGRVVTVVQTLVLSAVAMASLMVMHHALTKPWVQLENIYDPNGPKERADSNNIVIAVSGTLGTVMAMAAALKFNYLVWLAPKVWLLQELANMVK